MPNDPLTMRVFIVNTGKLPTLSAHRIEAAYYRTDGDFTTFKDDSNAPVFTVRNDHLVSVERAHGADPVYAAIVELLVQAREKGHANGKVTYETSNEPGGRTYKAGYDISVAATAESL